MKMKNRNVHFRVNEDTYNRFEYLFKHGKYINKTDLFESLIDDRFDLIMKYGKVEG